MAPIRFLSLTEPARLGNRVFEGTCGEDDFYLRLSTIAGDRMRYIIQPGIGAWGLCFHVIDTKFKKICENW